MNKKAQMSAEKPDSSPSRKRKKPRQELEVAVRKRAKPSAHERKETKFTPEQQEHQDIARCLQRRWNKRHEHERLQLPESADRLGQGRFATAYAACALDEPTQCTYAVKWLPLKPTAGYNEAYVQRMYEREVRNAEKMRTLAPQLTPKYFGHVECKRTRDPKYPTAALLVYGRYPSLVDFLIAHPQWSDPAHQDVLFQQFLRSLYALVKAGLRHNDLTSSNLFVDQHDDQPPEILFGDTEAIEDIAEAPADIRVRDVTATQPELEIKWPPLDFDLEGTGSREISNDLVNVIEHDREFRSSMNSPLNWDAEHQRRFYDKIMGSLRQQHPNVDIPYPFFWGTAAVIAERRLDVGLKILPMFENAFHRAFLAQALSRLRLLQLTNDATMRRQ